MSSNNFWLYITVLLMFGNIFITALDYDFDVFPVDKCPMSKEEWDQKSNLRGCNITYGYHCMPNKYLTSLIEFCSPQGARIPFEAGNCVELAARGVFNQVPCKNTFSSGCPDEVFYSQELFKYPKCLAIDTELRCFDADLDCICSRLLEIRTNKRINTTTENNAAEDTDEYLTTTEKVTHNQTADEKLNTVTVVLIVVVVVLGMLLICCLIGITVYLRHTGKICKNERGHKDLGEAQSFRQSQLPERDML